MVIMGDGKPDPDILGLWTGAPGSAFMIRMSRPVTT